MGPMGELGALFNPGMRHEQEERRAKALRREEEGDSREVDPRIDLESGVAVITTDDDASEDDARPSGHASAGATRVDERPGSASHPDGGTPATQDLEGAGPAVAARPRPRGKRGLTSR